MDAQVQDQKRLQGPLNPDEPEPADKPPMSRGRRLRVGVIVVVVIAAAVTAGVLYWLHARQFETTDDAFIDSNQSQVSTQISGRVDALLVKDNQHVDAGQVLFTLDPRDFQVKLDQSRAAAANSAALAAQARADLEMQRANLEQQRAQVRVAEADSEQAQQNLARYRGISKAAFAQQDLDQTSATARGAAAKLDSARHAVAGVEAQLLSQQAKIDASDASAREAEADVRNADLQLGYTKIIAPTAGTVTRRTVNLGNYVTPGQALLAIVPDELWVTANFKETQLNLIRVGQPVEITVDAFPDQVLHGHVDSFQRGAGSVFSSLPAENATGNYVKIVQRIPVKIVFDGDDWRRLPLAPGLSVDPRVTVR
jgi:membrane fusion protein (multidrug efflux system)